MSSERRRFVNVSRLPRRYATARVQNQLLTQIESLCRAQPSGCLVGEGSQGPPSPPLSVGTARTKSKWKRDRSLSPNGSQHSENSGSPKFLKTPRVDDIEEIVRKHVKNASQLLQKEMKPYELNVLSSPLSKEITSHSFLRKFVMPSFEYYSGAIDPILSRAFPSS